MSGRLPPYHSQPNSPFTSPFRPAPFITPHQAIPPLSLTPSTQPSPAQTPRTRTLSEIFGRVTGKRTNDERSGEIILASSLPREGCHSARSLSSLPDRLMHLNTQSRPSSASAMRPPSSDIPPDPRCVFPAIKEISPRKDLSYPSTPKSEVSPRQDYSFASSTPRSEISSGELFLEEPSFEKGCASNANAEVYHQYRVEAANFVINEFLKQARGDFLGLARHETFINALVPDFVSQILLSGLLLYRPRKEQRTDYNNKCIDNLTLLITHYPMTEELTLSFNPDLSGACLDVIAQLKKLVYLDASESLRLVTEFPEKLLKLSLKTLIIQSLSRPNTPSEASVGASSCAAAAAAFDSVPTPHYEIDDSFMRVVCGMIELQKLDIRGASITALGLNYLSESLINLSKLCIAECKELDSHAFEALKKFKSLQVLDVCGTAFNDDDLKNAATSLETLNCLCLDPINITQEGLDKFHMDRHEKKLPPVKVLNAEGEAIIFRSKKRIKIIGPSAA